MQPYGRAYEGNAPQPMQPIGERSSTAKESREQAETAAAFA